jgi:hypothetical protein
MAKDKDGKKYTPAQLMALKASVRTDLASKATVGPQSSTARMVDQSKLADPYKGAPKSQKAYNALNTAGRVAAETVALGAGGAALIRGATRLGAKAAGRYVGNLSMESAMGQNMKGLKGATGMGGKVSTTQTPMGPTLRSTKVGSPAEQSARIGNLETNAIKKSVNTGALAGRQAMIDVFKAGAKVKQAGATLGTVGITGKNRRSK